jgi:predicted Fe-Mo cluster-binding NifX family protein
MRIAMPVVDGKLSMHFGHCQNFLIFDIDYDKKKILDETVLDSPPHQPGLLPRWLAERNVNLIIAGGMGQHAQSIFQQNDIEVICGASAKSPHDLIRDYLEDKLDCSENFCDH